MTTNMQEGVSYFRIHKRILILVFTIDEVIIVFVEILRHVNVNVYLYINIRQYF